MTSLMFDISFTSQDFKNMDLTKVPAVRGKLSKNETNSDSSAVMHVEDLTTEEEEEVKTGTVEDGVRVSKLKLGVISNLKQALVRFASKEGTVIKDFFAGIDFVEGVFNLLDYGNKGCLVAKDLCARFNARSPNNAKVLIFQTRLCNALGTRDSFRLKEFLDLWHMYDFSSSVIDLFANKNEDGEEVDGEINIKTILDFTISFTNPNAVSDKKIADLDAFYQRLCNLEHPDLGITLPDLKEAMKSKQVINGSNQSV